MEYQTSSGCSSTSPSQLLNSAATSTVQPHSQCAHDQAARRPDFLSGRLNSDAACAEMQERRLDRRALLAFAECAHAQALRRPDFLSGRLDRDAACAETIMSAPKTRVACAAVKVQEQTYLTVPCRC